MEAELVDSPRTADIVEDRIGTVGFGVGVDVFVEVGI
jgi:hypothetical protein